MALIMLLFLVLLPYTQKAGEYIGSKLIFFPPKKEGEIIIKDSLGNADTIIIPAKKKKGQIIIKEGADTIYKDTTSTK
jgi:hypothetical protein